jgi:hypothetical protein
MLSSGITLLTAAGTVYTGYQAYHHDISDRQVVVMCAVGGLIFSIFLQAMAGKFSKQDKSYWMKGIGDLSWALSSVILPLSVAYGYLKKSGESISRNTFGMVQIDPTITLRGRNVTYLYPVLVGVNFGFLAGRIFGMIFKA